MKKLGEGSLFCFSVLGVEPRAFSVRYIYSAYMHTHTHTLPSFMLRQGVTKLLRMSLNLQSSCLNYWDYWNCKMGHCTWLSKRSYFKTEHS